MSTFPRPFSAMAALLVCLSAGQAAFAGIVDDVRDQIDRNNFAQADRLVANYAVQLGQTAELAAAISWLGRGALARGDLDRAERYATQARDIATARLGNGNVDGDPWLPTAIGASIEVRAQVMDRRGQTVQGVTFLRAELAKYRQTSLAERIAKNINLLSLEGSTAPALDLTEWIGEKPQTLAQLRGSPVVLFFWAHWCPDCKAEVPILSNLMRRYAPRGLKLVAPTRYYGYAAEGVDATRAEEKVYIQAIQDRYYSPIRPYMQVPLSNENFLTYGCSSTPTLAIVDKNGKVSWYHPGAATEDELAREIEKVL